MYYADPDGNQMEFQVDAFADDGCNAFIRGEQMALNPVGVEFDPEDWLARLRAGGVAVAASGRSERVIGQLLRGVGTALRRWAIAGSE